MISFTSARNRLALVWLGGSGLIFILLIAQTVLGKYESRIEDVWSWALPGFMPTLTLIVTVLAAGAVNPTADTIFVRPFFFRLALWLSVVYLVVFLATPLIEPFTNYDPLTLLRLSHLWLAPLQALVTSAVTLVFFSKEPAGDAKRHTEQGA